LAHDHLTYDDLLRIVELIKSSEQFSEFRLKIGGIEVELRRGRGEVSTSTPPPLTPTLSPRGERETETAVVAPTSSTQQAPSAQPTWPDDAIVVRAPMVGTFYRASQPGAPPFVEIGQSVEPDSVVCIIEVMKLMNSITAAAHGTVTHILVDDAAAVETGQPLIVLEPAR
jgi:acetyl-CoA carboxylase biotin carboxyl carrier protein